MLRHLVQKPPDFERSGTPPAAGLILDIEVITGYALTWLLPVSRRIILPIIRQLLAPGSLATALWQTLPLVRVLTPLSTVSY